MELLRVESDWFENGGVVWASVISSSSISPSDKSRTGIS